MSVREKVRDNPVRTFGGVGGAVLALLVALADWGLEAVAPFVPPEVAVSGYGLMVLVAGIVANLAGRWVQRRFTEPKDVTTNLVRKANDEPLKGGPHAKAMAGGTDPHGDVNERDPLGED